MGGASFATPNAARMGGASPNAARLR